MTLSDRFFHCDMRQKETQEKKEEESVSKTSTVLRENFKGGLPGSG